MFVIVGTAILLLNVLLVFFITNEFLSQGRKCPD